jgi:hypothetical protein
LLSVESAKNVISHLPASTGIMVTATAEFDPAPRDTDATDRHLEGSLLAVRTVIFVVGGVLDARVLDVLAPDPATTVRLVESGATWYFVCTVTITGLMLRPLKAAVAQTTSKLMLHAPSPTGVICNETASVLLCANVIGVVTVHMSVSLLVVITTTLLGVGGLDPATSVILVSALEPSVSVS